MRWAIGLGLAIVTAGVVVALSLQAPRLQGSNARVERSGVGVFAPGRGGLRCQTDEAVPAGTRELRLFAQPLGAGPGGPLDITVATSGREGVAPRVVSRAHVPAGIGHESLRVALDRPIAHDIAPAWVCLRNRGRNAIGFAGNLTPVLGGGANPYSHRLDDDVRVDYMRGGSESWWSLASTVAARLGLARTSWLGSWTMWAVFGALALLWAATFALLVRTVGRA